MLHELNYSLLWMGTVNVLSEEFFGCRICNFLIGSGMAILRISSYFFNLFEFLICWRIRERVPYFSILCWRKFFLIHVFVLFCTQINSFTMRFDPCIFLNFRSLNRWSTFNSVFQYKIALHDQFSKIRNYYQWF